MQAEEEGYSGRLGLAEVTSRYRTETQQGPTE